MRNKIYNQLQFTLLIFILVFAASAAFGAATITIVNNDGANEGFNDPTPATPVGGNPGTTIGQQRLNVFNQAAATWGATLSSNVTIVIRAQFDPLTCSTNSAVLGSAGTISIFGNFPNAPFTSTWYGGALADKLATSDRSPGNPDINATFNSNLGQTGCLDGLGFYYGYDGNEGTGTDLNAVLLHEFAHGFGFQTFTSGTSGAPNQGFFTIYDRFLVDDSTGLSWLQMTDGQRAASALGINQLAWNGPQVTANVPTVLGGPVVKINSPVAIAGSFTGGPAQFGPPLTTAGVTANVVQALDPSDGAGALTTDGCSALTNAAAVSGKIAIIDRGTCAFSVKVKNAQNAGAVGVIIADNVAGSPPAALGGSELTVTIPAERVTQADGNTIKAQLPNGVNATLRIDPAIASGFDSFSKALLYSPNPFQGGSSVSHWDTSAFPNQLMEPNINADLTHNVVVPSDLTFAQLSDIGWVASTLPNAIGKTNGDNQTAPGNTSFTIPIIVTVGPIAGGLPVTWTVNPVGGAGATFASTNGRVATSVTNPSGVATAPGLTANSVLGTYTMNATVPGAGTATFTLTNGPAASLATVSGKVLTSDGRGLRNASVTITDSLGNSRSATTSSFGSFSFDNVSTGSSYTFRIQSRLFRFGVQTVSISSDLTLPDFVGLE